MVNISLNNQTDIEESTDSLTNWFHNASKKSITDHINSLPTFLIIIIIVLVLIIVIMSIVCMLRLLNRRKYDQNP